MKKHHLRIIAGQWRGRKLAIANVEGLRPTGDRIRETLFNWLSPELLDSQCLDLFAGSGALGLECLSRGAKQAWMIEQDPTAASQLRQHCSTLDTSPQQVIQANSLEWLNQAHIKPESIDIAFIDPPFSQNLWTKSINLLNDSGILKANGLIYVESPKIATFDIPPNWQPLKEKQAGQIRYSLFCYQRTP